MSEKLEQAALEFEMDGKRYGFEIYASSREDAERRMRAIRMTGKVIGWPCYTYRVNSVTLPLVGAWVAISCFFRNLFRDR